MWKKTLAGFEVTNKLNDRRLKSYYKSLQREVGKLKKYFWCDSCHEYHYPDPVNSL